MVQVSGYELLRQVRADPNLRETPFVIMTTRERAHFFNTARQAGVNACLVKAFTAATLRQEIEVSGFRRFTSNS